MGNLAEKKRIYPTMTTDYRKAWSIERIVLDSIANHIDGSNETVSVKLKQAGVYVDLKEADKTKPVEEIVFEDDGEGYAYNQDLRLLYSKSEQDKTKIGQFGEGLKLVGSACLREGIEMEYHSRDWSAVPVSEKVEDIDIDIEEFGFDVAKKQEPITGSKTVFKNPSKKLVDEVFDIPNKVLYFNDNYEVLFKLAVDEEKEYVPKIIDLHNGRKSLFVKNMRFRDMKTLFSYDLDLEWVAPDRESERGDKGEKEREERIKKLLSECDNPKVLEAIVRSAGDADSSYNEFYILRREVYHPKNKKMWVEAFKKVYGDNAVIACKDEDLNKDAKYSDYKVVDIRIPMNEFLKNMGVESAEMIKEQEKYLWVDEKDLTERESQLITVLDKISERFASIKAPAKIVLYSGKVSAAGRKVKSNSGLYVKGKNIIGLHRDIFDNVHELMKSYMHELGHHVTGAGDYEREFTDFFVTILTGIMVNGSHDDFESFIQDSSKKEQKLANLIDKISKRKDGNRMRKIVGIVADHYKNTPDRLRHYFSNDHAKLAGVATSAYFQLTQEIRPIQMVEYGGLGVTIEKSEENLEFCRRQLHFAKLKDYALSNSKNSERSLWYSENTDNALWKSENSGSALYCSVHSDSTLWYSKNSGASLRKSVHKEGNTLWNSDNSGNSLQHAIIESAPYKAKFSGNSLKGVENAEEILKKSKEDQTKEQNNNL